jgi:pSer/pThr/pTyr-binding forkhead associated (FHA) protein
MSKIVVIAPDNSVVNVRLERERITIGRRPDNDVCLPYPAVSGEHAAVVTIFADSFLEDLGSTNGTLVNGKPIVKHFLRDHDQIDIGKQKLVYLANDDERYEPSPHSLTAVNMRLLAERVDHVAKPNVGSDSNSAARQVHADVGALSDELEKGIAGLQVGAQVDSMAGNGQAEPVHTLPPLQVVPRPSSVPPRAESKSPTAASPELTQSLPPMPSIKVLTGASAGRSVPLIKEETTVGRVGVAVAAIRRNGDAFSLHPLESKQPARVNGRVVQGDAVALRPGDEIEIAGTKLRLVIPQRH